jgi:ABC-2 type transport system permease protein
MNKFYAHYPQYKKYQLPDKSFNWLWYYAMQQLGDDESALDAALMKEKLSERERSSSSIAAFIPTMHTQLQFNAIAGSGMTNNLRFLDSTTAFHERLRLHFYPKIFEEAAVADENWKKFTPHYFSTGGEMSWRKALLPLLIAIALVWLAGVVKMKRVW